MAGDNIVYEDIDVKVTATSGTGSMGYVYSTNNAFILDKVTCKFATTASPNCTFTITATPAIGTDYGPSLLYSQSAATDYALTFFPTRPIPFANGDTLYFECATSSAQTWKLLVYTREYV